MAKIVLDFDGTIYSTAQRMIDLVKIHYPNAYKGGDFRDIKEYGFRPVLELSEDKLQELFNRKDFYQVEYFMEGALEFIREYQLGGHTVEILTVGTIYNNANKGLLLDIVGLDIKLFAINTIGDVEVEMDKGSYNANYKGYTIYIDDRKKCLDTVKGFQEKIQFREEGYVLDEDNTNEYNSVTNWDDAEILINKLIKYND